MNHKIVRLGNALLILMLLLSMFTFVPSAYACKEDKPCNDAPGQSDSAGTEVAPNGWDNGNADWKEEDENSVITNPGGQSGVVLDQSDATGTEEAPNGWDNGNADWKEEDENGVITNPGGQSGVVVVEIQTVETATNEATSQGNQPAVADCSVFEGTTATPLPEAEWITAEDMHDALQWDWKPGPTGGRNHIRNTNACVQSGNSDNWKPLRPEPANSHDDIASLHKLARWAMMYNMGQLQLVVTTP